MSRTWVWIPLPKTAWPTWAGSTPARLTASRTTVAARSQGGTAARRPPYLPSAVLVADRTRTSRWSSITPPVTSRTSHVHAAVYAPDLPGYVRGLVGPEETDDPRDLLRLAGP